MSFYDDPSSPELRAATVLLRKDRDAGLDELVRLRNACAARGHHAALPSITLQGAECTACGMYVRPKEAA